MELRLHFCRFLCRPSHREEYTMQCHLIFAEPSAHRIFASIKLVEGYKPEIGFGYPTGKVRCLSVSGELRRSDDIARYGKYFATCFEPESTM